MKLQRVPILELVGPGMVQVTGHAGDDRVALERGLTCGHNGVTMIHHLAHGSPAAAAVLHEATEGRVVVTGSEGGLRINTLIVSTGNDRLWEKQKGGWRVALDERTQEVIVRYPLRISSQLRALENALLGTDMAQRSPHLLGLLAYLAVCSRIKAENAHQLAERVRLYDAEVVLKAGRDQRKPFAQLIVDSPDDGTFGVSPRAGVDLGLRLISFAQSDRLTWLPLWRALQLLEDNATKLFEHDHLTPLVFDCCREWMRRRVEDDLLRAMHGNELETLPEEEAKLYLEHVVPKLHGGQVEDASSGQHQAPDDALLEAMEGIVGIADEAAREQFRTGLAPRLAARIRTGDSHSEELAEVLRFAAKTKVRARLLPPLVQLLRADHPDERERAKLARMREGLVNLGYAETSLDEVIGWAKKHLPD